MRLNANEILVTLMMSLIAAQVLNYLLLGPWKDPKGFNFPQSVLFQYDAMVPILIPGTRVNVSLLIALVSAILAWVFMQKSFRGLPVPGRGSRTQGGRICRLLGSPRDLAVATDRRIRGRLAGAAEVAGRSDSSSVRSRRAMAMPRSLSPISAGSHTIGIVASSLLMAVLYIGGQCNGLG